MSAREGADYHYSPDEKTAEQMMDLAEEFVERMERLEIELRRKG